MAGTSCTRGGAVVEQYELRIQHSCCAMSDTSRSGLSNRLLASPGASRTALPISGANIAGYSDNSHPSERDGAEGVQLQLDYGHRRPSSHNRGYGPWTSFNVPRLSKGLPRRQLFRHSRLGHLCLASDAVASAAPTDDNHVHSCEAPRPRSCAFPVATVALPAPATPRLAAKQHGSQDHASQCGLRRGRSLLYLFRCRGRGFDCFAAMPSLLACQLLQKLDLHGFVSIA
mmetsp:Transcript_44940/g.83883  ORF Transcript_44940/g.83883 Transcript_44940/m.83883 type:complete len:229 (+) Transcript_44940:362-1048(+)